MKIVLSSLSIACAIAFSSPTWADQTYNVDVVVVGAGLSGLAAGATTSQLGAKTLILEKLPAIGGAGNFPEGSTGVGSRIAKKLGVTTTVDQVFAKAVEFHHWRVNSVVLRNLLDHTGETIDWMEDIGVKFAGIKTVYPKEKSLMTWHIYEGKGAAAVQAMAKYVQAHGGKILTETPVQQLITEGGRVTGVIAKNVDGEKVTVNAKNVILATGGFASNKQMLAQYVPDVSAPNMAKLMYRGPVVDGRTGDGINMAKAVGAGLAGMHTLAGNSPYLDNEPAIHQFSGPDALKQTRAALSQPFLWVNGQGERFFNESNGSSFTDVYNAMTSNGGLMYSIFDEKMKQKMIAEGPVTPFNAIVVPGQKMTALEDGLQKGYQEGFAYKADTLDELAKKIGVPAAALKASIDKINRHTVNRFDPDWGRRPEHLFSFDSKGPYYALKGLRAFFLTLGGVKVDRNMRALTDANQPIPGLYVTGQDMGGLYDSTYDLLVEGSASGFAVTSGRLAGRHALGK